ncbi:MAG TPA: hypothetical protein VG323_11220 [Thermoanaerobaculia bacterium]|nr:hypothetical protein [Thermoanaerobaculia bacterium]
MIVLLAALLWQTDWNGALAQAKQEHKLVFVDYGTAVAQDPMLEHTLSGFILLRMKPTEPPAIGIFDFDGRERFRAVANAAGLAETIRGFEKATPELVQVAEMIDAKHELDANFLLASTYARLKRSEQARDAYAEAKKLAESYGRLAAAQSAEAQSAFTYVYEERAAHAVELLKALVKTPVNREVEAIIWLLLGHAYEAATDNNEARDAFRHARDLAVPGSRTEKEASAALKHYR